MEFMLATLTILIVGLVSGIVLSMYIYKKVQSFEDRINSGTDETQEQSKT
jgi:ABC-type lipoprotein release transport system permease subunit